MKQLLLLLFFLFIAQVKPAAAQSTFFNGEEFSKNVNDQEKFLMYIDSIAKYLYRNDNVVIEAIEKCESLFSNSNQLSNEHLLKFITQKIYFEQKKNDYLECYRLISSHNYLLDDEDISNDVKESYMYIKGYTFMTLNDFEEAQKTYYHLYELGQNTKDTGLLVMSLYSIGQIYTEEQEYESAIESFLQLLEIQKTFEIKNKGTVLLIDYELIEAYINTKQYEKAEQLTETALNRLDTIKIESFKPDFLLFKGEIALAKKDISTAQKVLSEVQKILAQAPDPMTSNNSQLFQAKVLTKQLQYTSALATYESLIEKVDTNNLGTRLEIYENAQNVCNELGNYSKAYRYAQSYIDIKKKSIAKEKQTQTAYLKVKFETEQKEKENELLAIQIHHKQSENKFLTILFFISFLGIMALFWAFYQKKKYSHKLQDEVNRQTNELKHTNVKLITSNEELDKFNQILSHDLKEPLRSIVSFSNLLRKEIVLNEKTEEYINFIEKSGHQLHLILSDVSIFQSVKQLDTNDLKLDWLNTELLVEDLTEIIQEKTDRKLIVSHTNLPNVFSYNHLLKLVFNNLITNGINFNQSETPKVNIQYFEKENFHYFEFQDNGMGIAPQFQDQVFGMFKRLNNRSIHNGSGLGLNITKKILEQTGGDICILSSTEGKGSIFQIHFPILTCSTQKAPAKISSLEEVI